MSRIVDVPAQFDEQGFDQLAQSIGAWPPSDRLFFDARGVQWAAPYALIGLLTAAQAIIEAGGEKPLLAVPATDDVRSYWGRIAFFQHAGELFEFHGKLPKARGSAAGRHAARNHAGACHRGRAPGGGTHPGRGVTHPGG